MRYEVLRQLREFMARRHRQPTYIELGALCKLRAATSIRQYLLQLEDEGLVVTSGSGKSWILKLTYLGRTMKLPLIIKRPTRRNNKDGEIGQRPKKISKERYAELLDKATAFGRANDRTEMNKSKGFDVFHDPRNLVRNGHIHAAKIG